MLSKHKDLSLGPLLPLLGVAVLPLLGVVVL